MSPKDPSYSTRAGTAEVQLSDEDISRVVELTRASTWTVKRYLRGGMVDPSVAERIQGALDDLELQDPWENDRR